MRSLQFFIGNSYPKFFGIIVLSLISSLTEGIGIAFFVPLLDSQKSDPPTQAWIWTQKFLNFLHLPTTLTSLLGVMIVIFFLKGILKFLQETVNGIYGTHLITKLRKRVFLSFCSIGLKEYFQLSRGSLTAMLTSEANAASDSIRIFFLCITLIGSIIAYSVMGFVLDWRIAFLGILFGFSLTQIFKKVTSKTVDYSYEYNHLMIGISSIATQTIASFPYLSATKRFTFIRLKFLSLLEKVFFVEQRRALINGVLSASQQPAAIILMISLILIFVVLLNESLSIVLVALGFIYKMAHSLMWFQVEWNRFSSLRGSLDSLLETASKFQEESKTDAKINHYSLEQEIEFKNVSSSMGSVQIIKNVSIVIKKGNITGLFGPSGSGKTTLAQILAGLREIDHGQILIDGNLKVSANEKLNCLNIGYLSQDPTIFDDSIAVNVSLSLDPNLDRVQESLIRAEAWDFVNKMDDGINSILGEKGGVQLSGGQKQRIALARELYLNPDILILDEPTSALDGKTEELIYRLICDLKGTCTIVLITHNPMLLEAADWIYMLERGNITDSGAYPDLIQRRKSQLFRDQVRPAPRIINPNSSILNMQVHFKDVWTTVTINDISMTGVSFYLVNFANSIRKGDVYEARIEIENHYSSLQIKIESTGEITGCSFVNLPANLKNELLNWIEKELLNRSRKS